MANKVFLRGISTPEKNCPPTPETIFSFSIYYVQLWNGSIFFVVWSKRIPKKYICSHNLGLSQILPKNRKKVEVRVPTSLPQSWQKNICDWRFWQELFLRWSFMLEFRTQFLLLATISKICIKSIGKQLLDFFIFMASSLTNFLINLTAYSNLRETIEKCFQMLKDYALTAFINGKLTLLTIFQARMQCSLLVYIFGRIDFLRLPLKFKRSSRMCHL